MNPKFLHFFKGRNICISAELTVTTSHSLPLKSVGLTHPLVVRKEKYHSD